jgi:hypothetical protein
MPQPVACDTPFALGDKGKATYPGGKDVIVEWPACPNRWRIGRRWGGAVLPLHMICNYELERELHRNPMLGAAGHRLLIEALRIQETPGKLLEVKRWEERKAKRGK